MALNPEVAEATSPQVETLETKAKDIAAQSWNQKDMHALSLRAPTSMPAEFGSLKLTNENDEPVMVAKVDATLNRKTGTLTVTELDGNDKYKKGESVSVPNVVSGNGDYAAPGPGADGKYDNVPFHGPIPKGDYLIGNGYTENNLLQQHPGGDAHWYRLYGKDGKGGYAHEKLANGRGEFYIHTGRESDGCVTVWSDAESSDAAYPKSGAYDKLKGVLDNTKPFEYKPADTYRGVLHVK